MARRAALFVAAATAGTLKHFPSIFKRLRPADVPATFFFLDADDSNPGALFK